MKKQILSIAVLSLALAACGGSSSPSTPSNAFPQPAGTAAVNFTIDDSANKVWAAGEMEWKGSMNFNATTRIATLDTTWVGTATAPTTWATLYDDGPWDQGGHEPKGAVAGDHKWGVTIFVKPDPAKSLDFEYGLRDTRAGANRDAGWIWQGSNGKFSIPANSTADTTAPGLTLGAFGTIDLKLVFDKAHGDTTAPATLTAVKVKGSAWSWVEIAGLDDGTKGDDAAADGKYTWVNSLTKDSHVGLNAHGDVDQFVFTLNGVEYRDAGGLPDHMGITAYTRDTAVAGSPWTAVTITNQAAGDHNNIVTIP